MYPWGLKVVLIEPGLHRTTLMSGLPKSIRTMLDAQPEDVKKDYGSAYFDVCCTQTRGADTHHKYAAEDALTPSPRPSCV